MGITYIGRHDSCKEYMYGGLHILKDMVVYKEYMYGGVHILEDMIVYMEYMYGGCKYFGRHDSV